MSQPDPLGKYLAGSIGAHAALIGLVVLSGVWKLSNNSWGSQHISTGSVGVTMVTHIPIPHEQAPDNPLANDSTSNVPQAPAPVKQQQQVKAPDPKAIAIPEKIQRKLSPKPQSLNAYRPAVQEYKANQVYSQAPQQLSSKNYGIQGAGGVDMGESSVFGFKFGAYANLMSTKIRSKWNTADVRAQASQRAGITFTIARNGSVSNVKISHPSGSYELDASGQRAVTDANPLPALPTDFDKSEATVELWFQLKQ